MKEYLNRKEYDNGDITIKLVKMGCDIDEENNHRVRGIIPTEDGKQVFVEVLDGHRFDRSHFRDLSKEEYLKKYPYENYLWCDFCFRVDIPQDYYDNYSRDLKVFEKNSYYDIEYNKKGIISFLQKLNKNITDIELVDKNYIDDYCDEHGFYRLYDDRLEHSYEPLKITYKIDNKEVHFDMLYKCTNYNHTVDYEEIEKDTFKNYKIEELYDKFGKEKIDTLFDEYDKYMEELFASIRKNKSNDEEIVK